MKIALFGGSGFVGTYLRKEWERAGLQPLVYQRDNHEAPYFWDAETGRLDYQDLEGVDLLVNLAGEPVGSGWWSEDKKKEILKSRVDATSFIATTIASLKNPPALWVNASAIGYYGDRGAEILDESSSMGSGFLAKVVEEWEKAAEPAKGKTRIVFSRFGHVLGPEGGALKKMLFPFRLGFGGKIGSGQQWWSWITLTDIKGAIEHVYLKREMKGQVNFVSPEPVMAKTFTDTLAKVLDRPHLVPMPTWAIKIVLGEMGRELLLASERVIPKKLLDSGYKFKDVQLEEAFTRMLETHE
jgi:uncharacterized protein (TIGR01777 family)